MKIIFFLLLLFANSLYSQDRLPYQLPSKSEILKIRSAVIKTNKGSMLAILYPEDAPRHVANFKFLADSKFYKNKRIHIYREGFILQTGARNKNASSGPGYTLTPEFNSHKHVEGSLSMVRPPDDLDFKHERRSHGSQFRILLQEASTMNGGFTVFGKIIKGMEVARKLRKDDIIKDITVYVQE